MPHSSFVGGFFCAQSIPARFAREGHEIMSAGVHAGVVTSGAPSPSLGKSIGLAYVLPALAEVGTVLEILVRGRAVAARVVETPFVSGLRAGQRPTPQSTDRRP